MENHHAINKVKHLFLWAIYTMAMLKNQRVNEIGLLGFEIHYIDGWFDGWMDGGWMGTHKKRMDV